MLRLVQLLAHFSVRRLQFIDPCLQPGLFGTRAFPLSLDLFLRRLQLLPQLRDLSLQLGTPLAKFARLLLGPFSARRRISGSSLDAAAGRGRDGPARHQAPE